MEAQDVSFNNQIQNYARGALWGSTLGDVIGAYLQFDSDITKEKINKSFTICGGGKHSLEPGQPTDDSQLAYSVGKGLVRGEGCLNLNFIAEEMANWYISKPIDVGGTIRKSVPKACNMKVHQAHLCRKGAKQCSQQSQSNGSLMAITPLGIWCYKLKTEDIIEVVRQYTILIHPNECVILANTFYVLILSFLLKNNTLQDKNIEAYQYAKKVLLTKNKQFDSWITFIDQILDKPQLCSQLSPRKKSGWVRIALTYSIFWLIQGKSYRQCIKEIISLKGDTDTNACIAGGLLGASYGFKKLQMEKQIQKIAKWRPNKVKRPDWLVPGIVVEKLVLKLIKFSPQCKNMVGSSSEYQRQKLIK